MKIAVVCDFLVDRGGMEREVLIFAKALDADVVTTQYVPSNTYKEFASVRVRPHPLVSYGKQLIMQSEAAKKFRTMDLSAYDLAISIGDWASQISFNRTLRGRHIIVTISPPRMFYDLGPLIERDLGPLKKVIFRTWAHFASKRNMKAVAKVNEIYVQSAEAGRRVQEYYGRKPMPGILYPPTEIKKYKQGRSRDYFLSVQRLMPAKRIEIQIEAFNRMPDKKLIIAGGLHEAKKDYFYKLMKSANSNIEFLTNTSDSKLIDLYAHAEGVIQTSANEDFGLVPVEAMASGKACIAVNEGGFRETITRKTGVLIDKPYVDNLVKAVMNFDPKKFRKRDLLERAEIFSNDMFIKKIRKIAYGK